MIERPHRFPPPAELGLLGDALAWLAGAQGAWPPETPARVQSTDVTTGEGIAVGRTEADRLVDSGVDLLVLDASGDVTAAVAVVCALLDVEPVLALGTSSIDGWAEQLVAVREALRAARPHVGDPERLAADPVVGRAAGLLAQSAVRRTPVVLGGTAVLAAAGLVAERMDPGARHWWLAGTTATSTAARLAFADLALEPLLDLGLAAAGGAQLAADLLVRGIELVPPLHGSPSGGV